MNYLVIDDDAVFAEVLMRALVRRGHCAQSADQGATALLRLTGETQRIILDLKLGDESGLQLLPRLLEKNPRAQVLVLTGYSSISTAVEAIKLGAVNYLCKPAGVDEIIATFDQRKANPKLQLEDKPPSVNRLEWEHIQRVLRENDGNISATARSLGMHRRTLQRKLQKRPTQR